MSGPLKSIGLAISLVAAVTAAMFTAKGIIQFPSTSCSRRDHSVCQASANSILKIFGCRRCGLSATRGDSIAQHGRNVISTIGLFAFIFVLVYFVMDACLLFC